MLQKCLLFSLFFFFSLDKLTLSHKKLSTVWQRAWVIEQTPGTNGMKACVICGSRAGGRAREQVYTAAKSSEFLSLYDLGPVVSLVCLRCGLGIRITTYLWCCYNLIDCVCSIFSPELVKGRLLWFSANKYAHFLKEVLWGHLASLGLSHILVAWS